MRRHRRHMKRVITFVILGAIINVAVAWTLAVSVDLFRLMPDGGMRTIGESHWSVARWQRLGSCRINSTWRRGQNPGQTSTQPGQFVPLWSGLELPSKAYLESPATMEQRTF